MMAKTSQPKRAIAMRDMNEVSLSRSASGGAFMVLARPVIDRGGIVYGCALDDDGFARHEGAETFEGLSRLQGSKYVQSNTGATYLDCAQQLRTRRLVLYTGTPCQIAALENYLAVTVPDLPRDTLITCDLICHGTTSPKLFKLYLDWLREKHRADGPITNYLFRSKLLGWGLNYSYSYSRRGVIQEVLGVSSDDSYYAAFLSGQFYRDCCYSCYFASSNRPGDFTIGDYWGIERQHPDFYDNRGVSVMLMNSKKALGFFDDACTDACEWIESTYEQAAVKNTNLQHPTRRTAEGEAMAAKVDVALSASDANLLFDNLLKPKMTVKKFIKRILPNSAVNFIKSVKRGK